MYCLLEPFIGACTTAVGDEIVEMSKLVDGGGGLAGLLGAAGTAFLRDRKGIVVQKAQAKSCKILIDCPTGSSCRLFYRDFGSL